MNELDRRKLQFYYRKYKKIIIIFNVKMFFRGYIVCETEHFDRRLAYMFLTPKRQND